MSPQYADLRSGDAAPERLTEVLAPPTTPLEHVRRGGDRHDYVGRGPDRVLDVDHTGTPTVLPVNDCLFDVHEDAGRARETVTRSDHVVVAFPCDEDGEVLSGERGADLYNETAHEDDRTLHALFLLPVPSVEDDVIEFHQFALVDEAEIGSVEGFRSYRASGHAPRQFFRDRVRDRARYAIGGPSTELTQLLREVREFVTRDS